MPTRLPFAALKANNTKDNNLRDYAQAVHDGLLASIATFPTPPVLPASLQTQIDTYTAALAAASDRGKAEVQAKNTAKFNLIRSLRTDCAYVNQIIFKMIASGTSYDAASDLILGTNYELSKDPTPAGLLPKPTIKQNYSRVIGQLYILVESLGRNCRSYQVNIGLTGTSENTWKTLVFPNGRITIENLTSAQSYSWRVAGVGTNTSREFTDVYTNVII